MVTELLLSELEAWIHELIGYNTVLGKVGKIPFPHLKISFF